MSAVSNMFKELESSQEIAPFAEGAITSFSLKLHGFGTYCFVKFLPLI